LIEGDENADLDRATRLDLVNAMPKIRALTSWSGRKEGEEWDASDNDARILCASDLAGGQRAEYVDRAMSTTSSSSPPKQETPAQEKKRYLRRDMRAEN
jgi:hypothetical protein